MASCIPDPISSSSRPPTGRLHARTGGLDVLLQHRSDVLVQVIDYRDELVARGGAVDAGAGGLAIVSIEGQPSKPDS